ncbi:MAG: hypothetical protein V5A62_01010 [Haloarculaceae archaeon]
MTDPSRRQVLQAGGVVSGCGMVGCLTSPGRRTGGGCSGGGRWAIRFRSIGHGSHEGFRLVADPEMVAFGDDITFCLRNVSEESLHVGTDGNYTIQKRHDDDWRNVFSTEAGMGWDGSAQRVDPNEVAFTWTFTVTETGFVDARYELCNPLTVGEYRFVYWALPDRPPKATQGDSDSTHHAVARRFTIQE